MWSLIAQVSSGELGIVERIAGLSGAAVLVLLIALLVRGDLRLKRELTKADDLIAKAEKLWEAEKTNSRELRETLDRNNVEVATLSDILKAAVDGLNQMAARLERMEDADRKHHPRSGAG